MRKELDHEELFELEEIYKAFGSMPRLRILIRLREGEATVGELTEAAGLSQSATSHQLKELRMKNIIKSRKNGLNIFYSLRDSHIFRMIESGMEHIKGEQCDE
ncbi:MAG: metalloregulator ArsR/SmtB family transcription factor [Methanomassiliicoccaceae archaeon]|nr:metalloregulator ArsR/SmtB family transcription factor [Methanomassiliicoccaceae archaeon]